MYIQFVVNRVAFYVPLLEETPERVKPATLEVRDEAAAKAALQLAVDTFGRLDVPVNKCRLWSVCTVRATECRGFQGGGGYMLLWRGVHNARSYT